MGGHTAITDTVLALPIRPEVSTDTGPGIPMNLIDSCAVATEGRRAHQSDGAPCAFAPSALLRSAETWRSRPGHIAPR